MIRLFLNMALAASPIKVLIIDTGTVGLDSIKSNMIKTQKYSSSHPHGTAITYLVINGTGYKKEKVSSDVIVEMCDEKLNKVDQGIAYTACLKKAATGNYDFINMSLAGFQYSAIEEYYLGLASRRSKIIVAAGNDSVNLNRVKVYPASYKDLGYVTTVMALNSRGARASYSNWGDKTIPYRGEAIVQTVDGTFTIQQGTSIATALYTHKLILQLSKERRALAQ
jgi:hypothetical protein